MPPSPSTKRLHANTISIALYAFKVYTTQIIALGRGNRDQCNRRCMPKPAGKIHCHVTRATAVQSCDRESRSSLEGLRRARAQPRRGPHRSRTCGGNTRGQAWRRSMDGVVCHRGLLILARRQLPTHALLCTSHPKHFSPHGRQEFRQHACHTRQRWKGY